jgi:hypothetical protein
MAIGTVVIKVFIKDWFMILIFIWMGYILSFV